LLIGLIKALNAARQAFRAGVVGRGRGQPTRHPSGADKETAPLRPA
jgi:hypothetical protein